MSQASTRAMMLRPPVRTAHSSRNHHLAALLRWTTWTSVRQATVHTGLPGKCSGSPCQAGTYKPEAGSWILNTQPHRSRSNKVYAFHNTNEDPTSADMLDTHRQLGHPSFKRMRDLTLASDEPTKPSTRRRTNAPPSCPTCVTAKMRRAPAPAASTPGTRAQGPWETVYIDLSVKVRARCFSNVSYFVVFI